MENATESVLCCKAHFPVTGFHFIIHFLFLSVKVIEVTIFFTNQTWITDLFAWIVRKGLFASCMGDGYIAPADP